MGATPGAIRQNDKKPMDKASEAVLALKPVTFRYDAVSAMLLNEFLKEHQQGGEVNEGLPSNGRAAAEANGDSDGPA